MPSVTTTAGETVVAVVGDLDLSTDPVFRACLDDMLDAPVCRNLIVDLRGVLFLGARGAGTLERAHECARDRGVRLVVVADTRSVVRTTAASGVEIVTEWPR